jgi:replicative DNA helicase
MGKTALAVNLAFNAAKYFLNEHKLPSDDPQPMKSVGFFSLEMSAEQLATRMLSMATDLGSSDIRRGRLDAKRGDLEKLLEGNRILAELPFFIDDTPALTIAAVRTRARRLKRKYNLGLLVVDYLQLLRGVGKSSSENRVQEVSEITQGLKAIAKELNIPVLALSQLSRAVESRDDKRPQLSDLRESGSIEQDSDVVMFIFREAYYVERRKPSETSEEKFHEWQEEMNRVHNLAEVMVAKHRNGPIGNVTLHFDGMTTRFSNHDRQHSQEPHE